MNLQTYLMIKQANEGISNNTNKGINTTRSRYLTDFGLGGGLSLSLYKNKRLLPGGVAMGTTPLGGTIIADGPPIVINSGTTNSNNGALPDSVKRHILRSGIYGTGTALGGTL